MMQETTHFGAHVAVACSVEVFVRPLGVVLLVLHLGGTVVFERELGVALQEFRLHALICN